MPLTLQYPVCHRVDDTCCCLATSVAMCCVVIFSILKRIFVRSGQMDRCLDVRNNKLCCNFCLLSLMMCSFVSGYKHYFKRYLLFTPSINTAVLLSQYLPPCLLNNFRKHVAPFWVTASLVSQHVKFHPLGCVQT